MLRKIIYSSVILLLTLSISGCESNSVETNVAIQENKDVQEEIVTKRISGETSKENLLKIKEYLFSGDELNDFKAKVVNVDDYIPEDEDYAPTKIYTVEMMSTYSKETGENIDLDGIEVLIDIVNISGDQDEYEIGDEFKYNKQDQFDSGWYIHDDQVLYISIY